LRQYLGLLTAPFGTGRVRSNLTFAQIVKVMRGRGWLVTFPRASCGTLPHARWQLQTYGFNSTLQTAIIKHLNLSVRLASPRWLAAVGPPATVTTTCMPTWRSTSRFIISCGHI
jgi:hypothetical protein